MSPIVIDRHGIRGMGPAAHTGWHWPEGERLAHYFVQGAALCNGLRPSPWAASFTDSRIVSSDDCDLCTIELRRIDALRRARAGKQRRDGRA